MAVWDCEGSFTAPSLHSFVSPNGETRREAAEGLRGGCEWQSGVGGTLDGCGAVKLWLGGMPPVPDGQGTIGPASNVARDVPEDGGMSFGVWVHAIWQVGEGPAWCCPPLLKVPPGVWKHTGGLWVWPRKHGGGGGEGGWACQPGGGDARNGVGACGDGLPCISLIPWGTWTRPRPVGGGPGADTLDGIAEAHGAWLPHVSLVLGGAWMRSNPTGDVSKGVDTLFDMGDTCSSHGEVPRREPWLGEVVVVSDGMGAVRPASDTSRGVPRHVGTSSCMQDVCGGRGDTLWGGGSLSCPGDSSMAPMASGCAIEVAKVALDVWQHVLLQCMRATWEVAVAMKMGVM